MTKSLHLYFSANYFAAYSSFSVYIVLFAAPDYRYVVNLATAEAATAIYVCYFRLVLCTNFDGSSSSS